MSHLQVCLAPERKQAKHSRFEIGNHRATRGRESPPSGGRARTRLAAPVIRGHVASRAGADRVSCAVFFGPSLASAPHGGATDRRTPPTPTGGGRDPDGFILLHERKHAKNAGAPACNDLGELCKETTGCSLCGTPLLV